MRQRLAFVLVAVLPGCGSVVGRPSDGSTEVAPRCDPSKPFGSATPLGGLGGFELQQSLSFVAGELTAYVALAHLPAAGQRSDFDIYKATRASDVAEFATPTKVGISTTDNEPSVGISEDGEVMVFAREPAAASTTDLYEADAAADGSFPSATRLAISMPGVDEGVPHLWGEAKTLYFSRYVDGVKFNDAFYAVRSGGVYSTAAEVPGVNTTAYENAAVVSASGLQLILNRADVMYVGTRTSTGGDFAVTELRDDAGTQIAGSVDWVSADGCRLYYSKATYSNNALVSSRLYVRSRPL